MALTSRWIAGPGRTQSAPVRVVAVHPHDMVERDANVINAAGFVRKKPASAETGMAACGDFIGHAVLFIDFSCYRHDCRLG